MTEKRAAGAEHSIVEEWNRNWKDEGGGENFLTYEWRLDYTLPPFPWGRSLFPSFTKSTTLPSNLWRIVMFEMEVDISFEVFFFFSLFQFFCSFLWVIGHLWEWWGWRQWKGCNQDKVMLNFRIFFVCVYWYVWWIL